MPLEMDYNAFAYPLDFTYRGEEEFRNSLSSGKENISRNSKERVYHSTEYWLKKAEEHNRKIIQEKRAKKRAEEEEEHWRLIAQEEEEYKKSIQQIKALSQEEIQESCMDIFFLHECSGDCKKCELNRR